jgi:hypothetical protein
MVENAKHKDNDNGFEIARLNCCTMISLKLLTPLENWIAQKSLSDEEAEV